MHQLFHRDLVDGWDRHLDVVVRLQHLVLHLLHLVNGMDLMMLVLHQYVVGNFLCQHLLVVVHRDVLQNLDEQNRDALLPFRDEVLRFLLVAVVDAELRHLLRMDCYQDVVGVELRHLLRMDCYQGVVPPVELVHLQLVQLSQLLQPLLHLAQAFQHRVMPSALQDRHQVRLQVQQLTLDLLRQSS
jgi:hypothetical protein